MSNILNNKSYKSYSYLSRYSSFPLYYHSIDKKYIYGTTSQLTKSNSYVLHKIKDVETLDSIALDYYNNPTFFWIIADYNNIQDPYAKLAVGSTLKIPTLNDIKYEDA